MTARSEREMTSGRRVLLLAGVCAVAVVIAVAAIVAARREQAAERAAAEPVPTILGDGITLEDSGPSLLFESTALSDAYGQVGLVPLGAPGGTRAVVDLACERVDYRAGVGVCLQADRGFVTTYRALVFDERFETQHDIGLAGSPSRVRISPSGTLAGSTVFISGHSYADAGFSTQTLLLDLRSGDVVADLESDFTVQRDGELFREIDFNFWGVTFIDDSAFYATLGSGGEAYLVRGDIDAREMSVVQAGVECPSISPDGTRIAYKSPDPSGAASWQIEVLDLATSEVTVIAESRSVDDQVAWLDDETLMYGLPDPESPAVTNTWTISADGSGEPTLLIEGAWSTRVVR